MTAKHIHLLGLSGNNAFETPIQNHVILFYLARKGHFIYLILHRALQINSSTG